MLHESSKSFWSWFIQTEWSTSHSSVSRPRPEEFRELATAAAARAARPIPRQISRAGRITAEEDGRHVGHVQLVEIS